MFGRHIGEPFRVNGGDQGMEQVDVIRPDAVVFGVAADGDVGDGRFAPEGAILAIEAKGFESAPVEPVPWLGFGVVFGLGEDEALLRVFLGQLRQPRGSARRAGQAVSEGATEFFASASTNSTSSCAIWPAHHSTASTTAR